MNLSRHGREYLRLTITTEPVLTGWEASFDEGTTWHTGEVDDGAHRWLIAGPDADVHEDAIVLGRGGHSIIVRATDTPEVIVRAEGTVTVT